MGALDQLFGGVELAVHAGVMKRDVAIDAAFEGIDFTAIEGLGIDVYAHGALAKFRQIQHLVNGLEGVDGHGVGGVHLGELGGHQAASLAGLIALLDTIILHAQAADGRGHPAILVTVIMDTAALTNLPTNCHHLAELVAKNEIARVVAERKEEIGAQSGWIHRMFFHESEDAVHDEVPLSKSGKLFHPVVNGEYVGHVEWGEPVLRSSLSLITPSV